MEIKAHVEVSCVFPTCPSFMDVMHKTRGIAEKFIAEKDGSLICPESGNIEGSWWSLSSSVLQVDIRETKSFLRYDDSSVWIGEDITINWTRKRDRDSGVSKTPTRTRSVLPKSPKTPNISRFRMCVLPIDPLDHIHRLQLQCMGLRICRHLDVGRVLVSSRKFDDGEIVIYSRVEAIDVVTDNQVLDIIDPNHPSCCYLLVPRMKKLYYNQETFSHEDPVASGDLWYLVNHSARPNTEILLRKCGIQLKAKRIIQPNEPITWTYPHGFFGKDEVAVDLPQSILPDDMVQIRE